MRDIATPTRGDAGVFRSQVHRVRDRAVLRRARRLARGRADISPFWSRLRDGPRGRAIATSARTRAVRRRENDRRRSLVVASRLFARTSRCDDNRRRSCPLVVASRLFARTSRRDDDRKTVSVELGRRRYLLLGACRDAWGALQKENNRQILARGVMNVCFLAACGYRGCAMWRGWAADAGWTTVGQAASHATARAAFTRVRPALPRAAASSRLVSSEYQLRSCGAAAIHQRNIHVAAAASP